VLGAPAKTSGVEFFSKRDENGAVKVSTSCAELESHDHAISSGKHYVPDIWIVD